MNGSRIRVIESYLVAGDETARPDSLFHTFPSLTRCADGSYLCATLVGTEKSGPDGRTRVFRSTDDCRSWNPMPSPTAADERADPRWGYLMCHLAETAPGRFAACYLRSDRFHPREPLFHPTTSGMQHTVVRLCDSADAGRTWSAPRDLDYRLPDLIAPGPFLRLPDGALGMPFEVWHEWDKGWREGPSTRLIRSTDQGRTWPVGGIIARDLGRNVIYGDPRLTVYSDGRTVALLWVYDIGGNEDQPVHRAESSDAGRTWSVPESTGLVAQICNPVALKGDALLAVYQKRFGADSGLRAILSRDAGRSWDAATDTALWTCKREAGDTNPFSGYEQYAFGYSTTLRISDMEALVTFWASNGRTTCIRILRVVVE